MDPFVYIIDGFRHGCIGASEAPLEIGYGIMVGGNVLLGVICRPMFKTGYRFRCR